MKKLEVALTGSKLVVDLASDIYSSQTARIVLHQESVSSTGEVLENPTSDTVIVNDKAVIVTRTPKGGRGEVVVNQAVTGKYTAFDGSAAHITALVEEFVKPIYQ